jgi:hypothetical protein
MRRLALIPAGLWVAAAAAGCGGSSHKAAPAVSTPAAASPAPATSPSTTTQPSGPGALQAEANAAAAGDIPDNQVFLLFRNGRAGYAMKYPEGWAQQGSGNTVVFRDKNNLVRVVVDRGAAPTAASVRRDLSHLKGARVQAAPKAMNLPGSRALKVVYSTVSAANAVTGKRVTLVVDRYYLWRDGRRAVVDLGTPQGVDNVDAYRLMIESFRWR